MSKSPFRQFEILQYARVAGRKNLFRISGSLLRLDIADMKRKCAEITQSHFDSVHAGVPPTLPAEYDLMSAEERRALFDDRVVAAIAESKGAIVVIPTEILLSEPLNLRYFSRRSERVLTCPLTSATVFPIVLQALKRSKPESPEKTREFFRVNPPPEA